MLMEKVKQHYKLGKFTWREGRFVGKQVTLLSDGSITLDQHLKKLNNSVPWLERYHGYQRRLVVILQVKLR